MAAHSLLADTSTDLVNHIRRILDESDSPPTLAIVFADPDHDLADANTLLNERGVAFVGATTSGAAADGVLSVGASSAILIDLPRDAFRMFASHQDETIADATVRLGAEAVAHFAEPVLLIFSAGLREGGDVVLTYIAQGAKRTLPVFGGIAGADFNLQQNSVFASGVRLEEGLVAVVLDGKRVALDTVASSGWEPVGIELEVTSSEGTLVKEINGQPVLDVYRSYMVVDDVETTMSTTDAGVGRYVGAHHPLSVRFGGAPPVMRTPAFIDTDSGGIVFSGDIPKGALVRFCMPPSFDVVERVVASGKALRERASDADAVLIVSCKARHTSLGPYAEDEIRALSSLWDAPQIGFFSYGEFGTELASDQGFHNSTCMLIALRVL